jgi:hypothetical protein
VLAAVVHNGATLQYAAPQLQADRRVVTAAVQQDGFALQWAAAHCPGPPGSFSALSVSLCKSVFYGAFVWARGVLNRQKRRFPARAVQADLDVLAAARPSVLAAVRKNGRDLTRAVPQLQADRRVFRVAVQQWGGAFRVALAEHKADREMVVLAVRQAGALMEFAAEELKADRDVMLQAVQLSGIVLHYATEELRADRELVLRAVLQDGAALQATTVRDETPSTPHTQPHGMRAIPQMNL